jgi:P pilus assembly chaperone PapD
MRLSLLVFISFLLGLIYSNVAIAQISVSSAIIHFRAGERPVMNISVGNSSDAPAYVVATAEEVPSPGIDSRTTEATTALLVSPKNFSIEPNGQRTVRLLLRESPGDTERVFRVSFVPQDRGFGEETESSPARPAAIIRVLTGMGVLVFADPAKPFADLNWERKDQKIVFQNSGNVHVHLSDGKACVGETCSELPGRRVYGGTSFEVDVPEGKIVSYAIREGASGSLKRISID